MLYILLFILVYVTYLTLTCAPVEKIGMIRVGNNIALQISYYGQVINKEKNCSTNFGFIYAQWIQDIK